MVDERTKTLINAAVDGELGADERTELAQILERSPEARDYQASLQTLDDFLTRLPRLPLPHDLHARITDTVTLPARPGGTSPSLPVFLRYGLAASVGLLLAIGFYETHPGPGGQQDLDRMIGTIAPGGHAGTALDTHTVDVPGLRSIAALERRDDAIVLDVTLDSTGPVELRIDLSDTALRFEALAQTQDRVEAFDITGQSVHARSNGRRRFAVLLRGVEQTTPDANSRIRLEYLRDGTPVQTGSLSAF